MDFVKHSELKDKHAFLGASSYHWINYDEEKLVESYRNYEAKERGTRLHAFAAECIRLGQKLPRSKKTLNMYVNDAIGYHMTPEQILYYSDNCFGTADTICFKDNYLRIHDLKSGFTPARMEQLMVYAALFCLEYRYKPKSITTELRIYQLDDVGILIPDPDDIQAITDKIIRYDKIIDRLKKEEGY